MVNAVVSADSHGSSSARKGVNRTADLVKLIADVEWIIGGLLCLFYFIYMQQAGVKISTALISVVPYAWVVFVCGMLIYALGEIVLLLTEIRNNQQMNMRK
jgi:hypothetical protein